MIREFQMPKNDSDPIYYNSPGCEPSGVIFTFCAHAADAVSADAMSNARTTAFMTPPFCAARSAYVTLPRRLTIN